MKRTLYIFISALGFRLLTPGSLQAQSYVGPSISGNFVQTVDRLPQTKTRLAGGGEVGVMYEWQKEHLLIHTGIAYSLQCPSLAVDSQWLEQDMLDTRGVPVTYRGLLNDRSDRMTMHQLTVPFMVGGTWHGVYLLGGLKLSVALATTARQDASLYTAGDYQGRYYDWFENMPNHGYHDGEPVSSSHAINLNRLDLRLAAELGYTFVLNPYAGLKPSPLLRVGLFAEYGMLNFLSSESTLPRTTPDWSQYLHVNMTHLYASEESAASRANLLSYGIRLTLLFPTSNAPQQSNKCMCLGIW